MPADVEEALTRFMKEEPGRPSRSDAVAQLVRESLEKLDYLEPKSD